VPPWRPSGVPAWAAASLPAALVCPTASATHSTTTIATVMRIIARATSPLYEWIASLFMVSSVADWLRHRMCQASTPGKIGDFGA